MAALVDWSDIERIAQDDGPEPVVMITYQPEYRDLMDLFRGVCAKEEFSQRALDLTAQLIEFNPANYTIWQYRRKILFTLGLDLNAELRYVEEVAYDNPKNYQIWYHRRAVLEKHGDSSVELQFVANCLEDDAKNYHAWSHRQWVLKTYGQWTHELEYIDSLLKRDPYNNSAWNQRWFVTQHTRDITSSEVIEGEVDFAFKWIWQAPDNESAWSYLRGLLRTKPDGWRFAEFPNVQQQCLDLKGTEAGAVCTHLIGLLIEIYAASLEGLQDDGARQEILEALGQCFVDIEDLDAIRSKYWAMRKAKIAGLKSEEEIDGLSGTHVTIEPIDE